MVKQNKQPFDNRDLLVQVYQKEQDDIVKDYHQALGKVSTFAEAERIVQEKRASETPEEQSDQGSTN